MAAAQVTVLPQAPSRSDPPAIFIAKADAFLAALAQFVTQLNALSTEVNTESATANASAATVASLSPPALAAANFKGNWSAQVGAAAVPYSVYHLSRYWLLASNIGDVTTKVPGTAIEWLPFPSTPTPIAVERAVRQSKQARFS